MNNIIGKKYQEALYDIGIAKDLFKESDTEREGVEIEIAKTIVHGSLGQSEESINLLIKVNEQLNNNPVDKYNICWEKKFLEYMAFIGNGKMDSF